MLSVNMQTNATQSDLLTRAAGLCLFLSHVIPASLCHLKVIYPQTDVLSLTVCSIFCPFKGYEWNAKPQQQCPRPVIVCATVIFLARRWKTLRKQSAEPLGAPRLCAGWRYGVGPVLLELLSCSSAPCSLNPSPVLVGVCMATCSHRPLGQPGRQRAIAMVIRAQNLRKAVHCDWCALRWEEQNVTATGFFLFVVFAFNAHRGLFSLWFICAAVC